VRCCHTVQVGEMVDAFNDRGDEGALTEVNFTLNVFCDQEGTMNVTSNDLELDQACPDIMPIGPPPPPFPLFSSFPHYTHQTTLSICATRVEVSGTRICR